MMGPVVATLVVRWLNYFGTLIFFACFVFIICISATCFIPKRIDLAQVDAKDVKDIPFSSFLKNPRVMSALVVDFIATVNLIFMDPILVLRL